MRRVFLGALAAGVLAGCGAADAPMQQPDPNASNQVPDFALVDTNSTSVSSGMSVSPRDVLERVSGWYFTHAS